MEDFKGLTENCTKCKHFDAEQVNEFLCDGQDTCPAATNWSEAKKQMFMQQASLMSVVVESLLYACEPSFTLNERNEMEYINVLEQLKLSNPEIFDALELTNINLFLDEDASESPHISKITQLLGNKLNVVDALK